MNRLMLGVLLVGGLSHAVMDRATFEQYKELLAENDVYLTQKGHFVNALVPLDLLYLQDTTYLVPNFAEVTGILESLIKISSGKIVLEGLIDGNEKDLVFKQSSLYAQVSHLSEFLLSHLDGVSYAPVRVRSYDVNDKYGIWEIYPTKGRFVNIGLVVD